MVGKINKVVNQLDGRASGGTTTTGTLRLAETPYDKTHLMIRIQSLTKSYTSHCDGKQMGRSVAYAHITSKLRSEGLLSAFPSETPVKSDVPNAVFQLSAS